MGFAFFRPASGHDLLAATYSTLRVRHLERRKREVSLGKRPENTRTVLILVFRLYKYYSSPGG